MLVEATDKRTGRTYRVRPDVVGHPQIGPHLELVEDKPSTKRTTTKKAAETATETPATGEKE